MKKLLNTLVVLILILFTSACGGGQKLVDGKYQAISSKPFNNWSHFVTFDIKDGRILNFKFDAVNLIEGDKETKAQKSVNNRFPLSLGNSGEWYEQAEIIDKFVVDNQGMKDIEFDDKGKTDAVSGATIIFSEVPDLIKKAKSNGPIKKGKYTDGMYFAEDTEFDARGFMHIIGYYVKDGVILGSHVDAYQTIKENGKDVKQYKTSLSLENKYDLGKDSKSIYDIQATIINEFIVKNQSFNPKIDEIGRADAISGASIGVASWIDLFKKAQENRIADEQKAQLEKEQPVQPKQKKVQPPNNNIKQPQNEAQQDLGQEEVQDN